MIRYKSILLLYLFFMKKIIYSLFLFISTLTTTFWASSWTDASKAQENTNFILSFFSTEVLLDWVFIILISILTIVLLKFINVKISYYIEKSWNGEDREELVWVLTRVASIFVLTLWITIVLGILWVDLWIFMWGLWFWLWFTLKIFLSNFIAWIIMVTQWSYHNWDLIELEGRKWYIRKINSLFTSVEQFDWVIFFVPNVKFLENNVQNFHANAKRRVEVSIWVDYDTDVVKAKKIIIQVLSNFPNILKVPDPEVLIENFDDSAINLNIRFWIDSKSWEYFSTKSNITETINLAFKHAWITIPYPQLTLSNRSDFKINPAK